MNAEQVSVVVALALPPLVNWVVKSKIPVNAKYVVAVVSSLVVATVSTAVHGFTGSGLLENVAVVLAAQHAAYELWWKRVFPNNPVEDLVDNVDNTP